MGSPSATRRIIGRYALYDEIAAGSMATVHYGRLLGAGGFSRVVAIKRLHPQYARDAEWVKRFLDEAHLVTRIRHQNVIPTLDVVSTEGELFIVMEYVLGETLARLIAPLRKRGERVPPRIACAIVAGVCHGLHAAHEAKSAKGQPLGVVHRDVSPHNVLVGVDGVPRLLDFGLAKANEQMHQTRIGELKGTLAYMAPEQLMRQLVTRKTDIYAAAVLLWEAMTGKRLFRAESEVDLVHQVLEGNVDTPSSVVFGVPKAVDGIVMRGMARDPAKRFETAREMADALDQCLGGSVAPEVGAWVEMTAGTALETRAQAIAHIESDVIEGGESLQTILDESDARPSPDVLPAARESGSPDSGATADFVAAVSPARADPRPSVRTRSPKKERAKGDGWRVAATLLIAVPAVAVAAAALIQRERNKERAGPSVEQSARPPQPSTQRVAARSGDTPRSGDSPDTPGEPLSSAAPKAPSTASSPRLASPPSATVAAKSPLPPKPVWRTPSPSQPAPSQARAEGCDPPFTFDENGMKTYKTECLH
jgi:serine/threonine-protein kinase